MLTAPATSSEPPGPPQPWPAWSAGLPAVTAPAGAGHRTEVQMQRSTKAAKTKRSGARKQARQTRNNTTELQPANKPARVRRSRTEPTRQPSRAAAAPGSSKQAAVIALLRRPEGATVGEVVSATGWQSHTVRGLFSGTLKKKLGLVLGSAPEEDRGRVYRIVDTAEPEPAMAAG